MQILRDTITPLTRVRQEGPMGPTITSWEVGNVLKASVVVKSKKVRQADGKMATQPVYVVRFRGHLDIDIALTEFIWGSRTLRPLEDELQPGDRRGGLTRAWTVIVCEDVTGTAIPSQP